MAAPCGWAPIRDIDHGCANGDFRSKVYVRLTDLTLAAPPSAVEECRHRIEAVVLGDEALPNAAGQDQRQLAAADLFVMRHMAGEGRAIGVDSGAGKAVRKVDACQMRAHAFGVCGGAKTVRGRELMREHHARRDGFAMEQPVRIARFSLERVAEAVSEVEQRANILRLALVGSDDPRLGRDAVRNRLVACRAVAREQRRAMVFAPCEEIGVVDQAIFDDLGIARAEFAARQRFERVGSITTKAG